MISLWSWSYILWNYSEQLGHHWWSFPAFIMIAIIMIAEVLLEGGALFAFIDWMIEKFRK